MAGAELRRLREANNLSREKVAEGMRFWGWYEKRVKRLERAGRFCLETAEMHELLRVLNARSF